MTHSTQLSELAAEVRSGDRAAAAELFEHLQEPLRVIICRVLRNRGQGTSVTRKIHAHLERLMGSEPVEDVSDATLDHAVRHLSGVVVQGLQRRPVSAQTHRDTVVGR